MSEVWSLFLLVVLPLSISAISSTCSTEHVMAFTNPDGSLMVPSIARNLKEKIGWEDYNPSAEMNLEDYHPIDPSPATKAAIRPGPIQHESPINPYIPKPPSPDHPQNGG